MKNPIQPLEKDKNGIIRFKENKIVRYLLDNGGIDLNQLALIEFSDNDREQLSQLIGYSLSGFGDLSYVTDETFNAAENMLKDDKTKALQERYNDVSYQLDCLKESMRNVCTMLFNVHPEDLN